MSRRWNGIAATWSRQNSLVSITIVNPRYCSPSPSGRSTAAAVSRVPSFVSGFDLSTVLQNAWTAERIVSRRARVSGTALNAAELSLGGLVGAGSGLTSGSGSTAGVTGGPLAVRGRGCRAARE